MASPPLGEASAPNPLTGSVPLRYTVFAVISTLIQSPFLVATLLVRRLVSKSDVPIKTDLLRGLLRNLYFPLPVMRGLTKPRNVSHILNSNRFASSKSHLSKRVLKTDVAGYWICQGPPGTPMAPEKSDLTLFWIHGGAYILGHPLMGLSQLLRIAEIAVEQGVLISIFSLEYSLAPESIFPKQIAQATSAYKYLLEEMHIESSKIVVGGESAGGHLAMSLLYGLQEAQLPKPGGALLACPWLDLTNSGASVVRNKYKDSLNKFRLDNATSMTLGPTGHQKYAHLLNFATPLTDSRKWKDILPSKTWATVGTHDIFIDSITTWAENAKSDGAEVGVELVDGVGHAGQSFSDHFDEPKYIRLAPLEETKGVMLGAENLAKGLLIICQQIRQ